MSVEETLQNRHGIHGDFSQQSSASMNILRAFEATRNWDNLPPAQEEALLLIAVKIGRILTGDHNTADHWHDIAGYAQLVENILNGKPANGVIPPDSTPGPLPSAKKEIKQEPSGDEQALKAWRRIMAPEIDPRNLLGDPMRGPWRIT